MAMDLTEADRKNILNRVNIVNNYHSTLTQDIAQMTKLQKKLTSQNMNNYDQVHKLLADYPNYNKYRNHSYETGNEFEDYNDSLYNAFTLPSQFLTDSKKSGLNYHYSYNMKLKDAYREYQNMMSGAIYGYLYKTYGKSIPNNLSQYIDYSGILEDSHRIFDDLEAWWKNISSKSINEYSKKKNKDILERNHASYIRHVKEQMNWLVKYNHFNLTAKRTLHVSCGDEDLGIKTLLGSDAINAVLFYGTYNLGMDLTHDLFHDYRYKVGKHYKLSGNDIDVIHSYKNHNFTIKFLSPISAIRMYDALLTLKSLNKPTVKQ